MLINLQNLKYQERPQPQDMLILLFLQDQKSLSLVVVELKEKSSEIFMRLILLQWHGFKDHKVSVLHLQDMAILLFLLQKQKFSYLEALMVKNISMIFMYST